MVKDEGGADAQLCDVDLDELKGDEAAMLEWTPDPVQADPSRSSCRRTADVLSILVNIYGSKALFVHEFRSMLADKLLNASDYETDREVRNLEVLKKRFGESALLVRSDAARHRRVAPSDAAVQRHFDDEDIKVLDATIVSRLCWPMLSTETFELPPDMAHEMARFEKQFASQGAAQAGVEARARLRDLDVAFADRTIKAVRCSPLHATILLTFGKQPKASPRSPPPSRSSPRPSSAGWCCGSTAGSSTRSGARQTATFCTRPPRTSAPARRAARSSIRMTTRPAAAAAAEAQLGPVRVYEQYVIGMLTNLGSLPVGRIHNMLRMFVPQSGADQGFDDPRRNCNASSTGWLRMGARGLRRPIPHPAGELTS